MKLTLSVTKIFVILLFIFLINLLTISLGDDISSVTVVNLTDYFIDVLAEGKFYAAVEPGYAIIHTTDPKPAVDVTVQYTTGQEVSGSVTRTLKLPYRGRNETCECDQNDSPRCVTYPEEGGTNKWEVLPQDFAGTEPKQEGRGTIFINGELRADDVLLVPLNKYGDFALSGTNWSGSGTSTAYFDNIAVLSYPGSHFLEDFESYAPGSYPSANWVNRFSGKSAVINDSIAQSGNQSFQLVSLPSWARVEAHILPAVADSIIYEGQVYLDQSGRGAQIGFGETESSNTYRTYNTITFGNDNSIIFSGADTSLALGSWTHGTWYKVRVSCNFIALSD